MLSKSVVLGIAIGSSGGFNIHFDPRQCVVPPEWKAKQSMTLMYGLNVPVQIPDLEIDDTCLMATFSFNRTPFHCRIPLSAVFAISDFEGKPLNLWREDLPPELQKGDQGARVSTVVKRGKLTLVVDNTKLPDVERESLLQGTWHEPSEPA